MTLPPASTRLRGGPLVILVLLLGGWSAGRAVWWENPFTPSAGGRDGLVLAAVPHDSRAGSQSVFARAAGFDLRVEEEAPFASAAADLRHGERGLGGGSPRRAAASARSWPLAAPAGGAEAMQARSAANFRNLSAPPFLPQPTPAAAPVRASRWSAEAWAFWRQGSDAAPISQGRVPIYGASQVGAVLQYRLAPGSARDPRIYARAYRALVRRGESELALGGSLRPLPRVPLRVAGEVRYTDGAFSDTVRPAAYVVSELAPVPLPYGALLEAYGQAGWVGGPAPTAFADGQASITGEWRQIAGLTDNALRLRLGAAAWGGAQRDAQRIDIGPTLRIDMTLGQVPARLSVDWRERVGGDAGPDSGLAATISTSF